MPLYDYRCPKCGHEFEVNHGFDEPVIICPNCGKAQAGRIITTAPKIHKGMEAYAGDGHSATKEELQDKWKEETPKLRKKLVDKLGEDFVNQNAPELKPPTDD
jgi:putative FmdB family regulatory protein